MSKGAYFAYDNMGFLVIAPGNIITGPNLQNIHLFLMKVGYFALRKYYMGGGIEGELKVNRLEMLPIPKNMSDDIYDLLSLTEEEIKYIENYYDSLI